MSPNLSVPQSALSVKLALTGSNSRHYEHFAPRLFGSEVLTLIQRTVN